MLEYVISTVLANVIVVTVVAYLTKSLLSHLLEKDVLVYKARLEEKAANALDSYRSDLEKERIKLQISYGGIFEKQANAILELFRLLVLFERQMQLVINENHEGSEYLKFIEAWKNLIQVYEEQKILLTPDIDKELSELIQMTFMAVQDYKHIDKRINKYSHTLSEADFDRLWKRQDKALEIMARFPHLQAKLTAKLRQLIGVHHSDARSNIHDRTAEAVDVPPE